MSRWVTAIKERLSSRHRLRRRILQDLKTLDELKDIVALGATLSDTRRDALAGTGAEPTREALAGALRRCPSVRYSNGLEAYQKLSKAAREHVREYAAHHYTYKPRKDEITALAISGGGGKAQFYLGALRGLEAQGVLGNINTFAGSSAGALCALPLAMGMALPELDELVRHSDFRAFFADSKRYSNPARRETAFHDDIGMHLQALNQSPTPDIASVVAGLRFVAESHQPQTQEGKTRGTARWLFDGEEVAYPVTLPLNKEDRLKLIEALWDMPRVRAFCRGFTQHSTGVEHHRSTLKRHFRHPKAVLDLMVTYAFGGDGIEHYFGRIIERQIEAFVSVCGRRVLASILPDKTNPALWPDLTFEDLGKLADSPEGRAFGFRHLVMGVTQECRFSWRGHFASSEPGGSSDPALARTPIREVARASMSLPLVFDSKTLNGKCYRDGGIRHNLPTVYFDRRNRGKSVLSLIPFEGHAVRGTRTIRDGFRHTQKIPWDRNVLRWLDPAAQKNFWMSVLNKSIAAPANALVYLGNEAYQKMGLRESFRNILIDTGDFGTLNFKVPEPVFERVNWDAELAVNGSAERPGLFDSHYSDCVALYDYKVRHYEATHPELVAEVRAELAADRSGVDREASGACWTLKRMMGDKVQSMGSAAFEV